ncbi:MAG: hypothetical protein GWP08_16350 [Nitrospiraceae bacterium]|nr:hypothetical protein [Nitrospiraceae bacterium]
MRWPVDTGHEAVALLAKQKGTSAGQRAVRSYCAYLLLGAVLTMSAGCPFIWPIAVTVTPCAGTIQVGETLPFSAARTGIGATTFEWSSSDPSVATVDANGVVTGVAVGVATITATGTNCGASDSAQVTVREQTAAHVTVTPETANVDVGQTTPLSAVSTDPLDGFTWFSSNETIATVDANGVVTGVAPGPVTIMATGTSSGLSDHAVVTVDRAAFAGTPVPERFKHLNLLLMPFHDASDGQETYCTDCHGDRKAEQAAFSDFAAFHSVMQGRFADGDTGCLRCHIKGTDVVYNTTSRLRQDTFDRAWCASPACHGSSGPLPFYMADQK